MMDEGESPDRLYKRHNLRAAYAAPKKKYCINLKIQKEVLMLPVIGMCLEHKHSPIRL